MLLGPIFRVEMVTVARRKRYFFLRVLYGAIILLVLWTAYSTSRFYSSYNASGSTVTPIRSAAALAASFFVGYSYLQLLAIMTVGPAMAVGTIATERERRTIEYLFATDLSNAEIVLGKTFARLTLLGQFVLVGLPILFLFRLLGGIPGTALTACFLSTFGTATMLTALSILVSVWSPRARDATVRIYLLLLVLIMLPAVLHGFQSLGIFPTRLWESALAPLADVLKLVNPFALNLGTASAVGLGIDLRQVFLSVGSQLALSAVCLLSATAAVRRVHLGEASRVAKKIGLAREIRVPRWRLPLGDRPMLWKEMVSGTATTKFGFIGWIAIFIILLTVLGSAVWAFGSAVNNPSQSYRDNDYFEYLSGLNGFLGSGILLLLAARASGLFTQEKERDCWTSLLSTPLTGREIVTGKMWGNLYAARWALTVMMVAWLFGLLLNPMFFVPSLFTLITFLVLAVYATNLGLLFSLASPTSLRAMGLTLGTIVFCGGAYLFCCCVVFSAGGGGNDAWALMMTPCIPMLLVFPTLGFLSFDQTYFWDQGFPVAYILGMILYTVAALGLYLTMVRNFDEYAGRSGIHSPRRHEGNA